ncbi:hypothetical protein L596_003377 [Steinernema carpocapsae]|nr:hypothetical protein L596_003377 [Steinernema carpocapsae]
MSQSENNDPILNIPTHIVATFANLERKVPDQFRLFAELSVTAINDDGLTVPLFYSSGTYRDQCSYQLYFNGLFTCTKPEQLLYLTVFADDPNGFTMQRTEVATCTHFKVKPSDDNNCQNGGVENPLNGTQCICKPHFTGDRCEDIICSNNGTSIHGRCDCPYSFSGRFCERIECTRTAEGVHFESNDRSLVFVLSTRTSMQNALNSISAKVDEMVRDLQSVSENFIKQYTLIIVNQTDISTIRSSPDPQGFIDAVKAVAQAFPSQQVTPETSCNVLLEKSILEGLKASLPNSYIFVFSDSDSVDLDMTYVAVLQLATEQHTSVFVVGTQDQVCGSANGTFGGHFSELADYTLGDIFYTANPENVLEFVPTLHDSGLAAVWGPKEDECLNGATVYVPVDGSTQTLTIVAHGQNPEITVTTPDGSSIKGGNATILSSNETLIQEFVIPCKAEFESIGLFCYNWNYSNLAWQDAFQRCHGVNSYLADILSPKKNDWFAEQFASELVWIGLRRTNGIWKWDAPRNAQQQKLSYTNWAPNEPSPNGSGKDCVLIKKEGDTMEWFTADCNEGHYSACQMHRYGQDMPPDRSTNVLPAGLWEVTLTTSTKECSLSARVQSYIQVYYGMTTDGIHSDQALPFANKKSKSNRIIATTTALDPNTNRNRLDGKLNYAFMYKRGTMLTPVTLESRKSGCTYKSVSQAFACPNYSQGTAPDSFYSVKFSGIDQFGNLFERWSVSGCQNIVYNCQNRGFESNGKCICPAYFQGPECRTPICLNNGLVTGNKCTCMAEFTGDHCEYPVCAQQSAADFGNDNRTLAIVLETTFQATPSIHILKKYIRNILQTAQTGPASNWFNNYILYPFDSLSNKEKWYQPTVVNSIDDFEQALHNIPLYKCPGDDVCGAGDNCPRPIITAIKETITMSQFAKPNSVVLVVTRSSAEDAFLLTDVAPIIRKSRAQINFILSDTASPCNKGFDSDYARALFMAAEISGGNVFLMNSGEMGHVFLPKYLPSLYKSATLVSGYVDEKCDSLEYFFQLDSKTTEFTVEFYAQNPSVTIIDPNGNQLPDKPSLITSASNYVNVFDRTSAVNNTLLPGLYRIRVHSTGTQCALNIRGRSSIEIYAGFTQINDPVDGLTQDDSHFAPVAGEGKKNVVMFHADGLADTGGVLYYVQMISPKSGLFFTTLLVQRQHCTYQYVSTEHFDCPESHFQMVVHGMDSRGRHFERMFLTSCVKKNLSALPSPPTCDLSATKTDFVFVLDSSSANDPSTFNLMKKLVSNTVTGYQLDSGNTQVAALTVSNVSHIAFNYTTGAKQISDSIANSIVYDGAVGQALANALKYVQNTLMPLNRPEAGVRYQLVYITSNRGFTDGDPIELANLWRKSGSEGILTIGYKIPDTDTFLELVATPKCTFVASSDQDLVTYGQNFIQSNSCRENSFCG